MKLNKSYFILIAALGFFIACTNESQQNTALPKATEEKKPLNPFPFYKNIEIKQGYHFEVVSWGKGTDSLGAYLILMSDSLKNNYKSLNVERQGIITDAWNMDLDNDGNPEIYVQYLVRKNITDLNVYEFAGNNFDKISFPSINSFKGYQGNDKFFVKNGELFRQVPLVLTDSGKTITIIKTLKYSLRGNSFSSSEAKPE